MSLYCGFGPLIFFILCLCEHNLGLFHSLSDKWLDEIDTNQKNYGVAICDVDNDGHFEIVVAGFAAPNLVLKYDKIMKSFYNIANKNTPYEALMDSKGETLGVCCCDIDGDGREEIYFVNSNNAYAGFSSYGDKLFKWRNNKYVDLFLDSVNNHLHSVTYSGRSASCLDRYGRGKYGIIVATYAYKDKGKFMLYEMDEYHAENDPDVGNIVLIDVAKEAAIDKSTGGRGIYVGPIINAGKLDIFFNNEGNNWLQNTGQNFLFMNLGNGTFLDVAASMNVADEKNSGRGISGADFNHDGLLDIVLGNYEGTHRLYIQKQFSNGTRTFINVANTHFEKPSMVRNVLVEDFDNNGELEVFFNNIREAQELQENRLFTVRHSKSYLNGIKIDQINPKDATDADGFGTGAAFLDVEGDGFLELVLAHGEDVSQPLDIFNVSKNNNNWLRILPRTKYGAPARGATVSIITMKGNKQLRIIDSGSAYLCQMEPVAHFGLGLDIAVEANIIWPDGKSFLLSLSVSDMRKTLEVYHPDFYSLRDALKSTVEILHPANYNHTEL